jgi:hypothetical protein
LRKSAVDHAYYLLHMLYMLLLIMLSMNDALLDISWKHSPSQRPSWTCLTQHLAILQPPPLHCAQLCGSHCAFDKTHILELLATSEVPHVVSLRRPFVITAPRTLRSWFSSRHVSLHVMITHVKTREHHAKRISRPLEQLQHYFRVIDHA